MTGFEPPLLDAIGRPLRSLRLSVTDRCNARCKYCMPEQDYAWLPKERVLSFEELRTLAALAVGSGVRSIRLTGGEPLLRNDLPTLVRMLSTIPNLEDLALTTNGILLAPIAESLRASGLARITVSLDTLKRERYASFTGTDQLSAVLKGLEAIRAAGFESTKINTVVLRGFNDDEISSMLDFARRERVELRFIEYMDVGGATAWASSQVVSSEEILERIRTSHGSVEILPARGSAPSQRYRTSEGVVFGVIASVTEPFCSACDRARITADGTLYTCLYGEIGTDLRRLLRQDGGEAELRRVFEDTWRLREDEGAVNRAQEPERSAWVSVDRLRKEPRLEMHTRGG